MKRRIIAKLELKSEHIVKPIFFEGLKKIGNPKQIAEKYYKLGIEEIILKDIVASLYQRALNYKLIETIIKNLPVPIALGGGVKSIDDVHRLINCGADKICINTGIFKNKKLIDQTAKIYGSQSIVVEIQSKKIGDKWFCLTDNGRINTNVEVGKWISETQDRGAGELFLQSVDKDGTMEGFDIKLFKSIQKKIKIPVIFSGGCGSLSHIKEILKYKVSGICLSSVLHYKKIKVKDVKKILK